MDQGENLDAICRQLVDNAIRLVKDFAHGGLVPLGDHSTLFGEVPKQLDPTNQGLKPFMRGMRTVECDMIDRRLRPTPRSG